MKISLMNIQRQHEMHAEEYEQAALDVLRSGMYIGGEEVTLFENEFAKYEGANYGISCGNGTDALVLALRALGIGQGDEVITVAWTFFATAESISAVGAKPVFVDVKPDTYCMDPGLVESAITNKTKAILPVHFYGQSCDMDSLKSICEKHGLYLITDCAQSAGSKYKGKKSFTLGDVACFSFFPTKVLGGAGDGGMVLTNNENIATACRALKAHGSGKNGLITFENGFLQSGSQIPSDITKGDSKYYNYLIGYNSRLDAIQASILRKKLKYLDSFVEARRKHARLYNQELVDTEYITPFESPYCEHSYYIYALQHENAPTIISYLNDKGIQCGTYYPVPLHLQGAFYDLGYKKGDLPVTESLAKTTFAIPIYPELFDEEIEYILNSLKEALDG